MSREFSIPVESVIKLLGLEISPRSRLGTSTFYVNCPFCGDKKYHMCVDIKGLCRCNKCNEGCGVLDLYGRLRWNTPMTSSNSKELFIKLKEDLDQSDPVYVKPQQTHQAKEIREIEPAPDDDLDLVYSELLKLPYLKLTDGHRQNLISRGLPEADIDRNGYASMPAPDTWIESHPKCREAKEKYTKNNIDSIIRNSKSSSKLRKENVIAGMLIANDLRSRGISPKGVPGFFRLGKTWCFKAETGMIIPTRNSHHQIVGLQVRRDEVDEKQPRYMTVSSKGFDGGVTVNISRLHIPLANPRLNGSPDVKVYLTEGPLKADIASALMDEEVFFIAVQGVSNTKGLRNMAGKLKEQGVDTIYNCFDMDKLTNPHVAKAGVTIRKLLDEAGIKFVPVVWDRKTALEKTRQLKRYCRENNIEWIKDEGRLSLTLTKACQKLHDLGIDISNLRIGDETVDVSGWNKSSKGIDDYLNKNKNRTKGEMIQQL